MASSSSTPSTTFMVGSIEVTTATTTSIIPVSSQSPTQTPPQSPLNTTTDTASSSSSKPPSPPKKKKAKAKKRVGIAATPIQMIPAEGSSKSPKLKSPTSKSLVLAKSATKAAEYPLQKDTQNPTVFAPGPIPKNKNFSPLVVPAQIKLAANNFKAAEEIPASAVADYEAMGRFIFNSPVGDALSVSCSKHYHHLLQEFWWTASYNEAAMEIIGTVLRGSRSISISVHTLREALELDYLLPHQTYEAPATTDEWKQVLLDCGYNFNVQNEEERVISSTPLKSRLPGVYHYLLTNIIQCLGGNSGSFNQANHSQMQIFHGLVTGRRVDYAAIIFADMVHKVSHANRATTVPYSRFFSLIIRNQLGSKKYYQEGYAFTRPSQMNQQVFKVKGNIHVAQLSPYIREFLSDKFPLLYPSAESLLVAQNSGDASAAQQVPRLPQREAQLVEPSAGPTSPSRTKRARTKTTKSQPAGVKKRQQETQKGSPSGRRSPTPRDQVGTDAPRPAASKKAAGTKKRRLQTSSPTTSVGRGGEDEQGPPQPRLVVSVQPIATTSPPPESAPLKEVAMSQAASEVVKSAPRDTAGKTQSAVEGPSKTSTVIFPLQVPVSVSSGISSSESDSAESLGAVNFDFLLGASDVPPHPPSPVDLNKPVLMELVDESSDEEMDVEEVFAEEFPDFFSPPLSTVFPPLNLNIPPLTTTLPNIPVSVSPPPIVSTRPSTSAAFVVAGEEEDIKPLVKPKWLTLKDVIKKLDELVKASHGSCKTLCDLVDKQYQCHQTVVSASEQLDHKQVNLVECAGGLFDLYAQMHHTVKEVSRTLEDEVLPTQHLVCGRLDRVAGQQGLLGHRLSDLQDSIKSSIAGVQQSLQAGKIDSEQVAQLLQAVTGLERSSTTLIAKVEQQLGDIKDFKDAIFSCDKTVCDFIPIMNQQTIQMGKLTEAFKDLYSQMKTDSFTSADRQKLDKVADDVSLILSLLQQQQQQPTPSVPTAPSVTISPVSSIPATFSVEVAPAAATSKGEETTPFADIEDKTAPTVSDLLNESEQRQQSASPSSSKGEQRVEATEKISGSSTPIIESFEEQPAATSSGQEIREIVESGFNLQEAEQAGIPLHEIAEARRLAIEMDLSHQLKSESKVKGKGKMKEEVAEELKDQRKQYFSLIRNRVDPDRIVSASVTCPKKNDELNVFITRKKGEVSCINNIKDQSLGVTEWVELYYALKQRPTELGGRLLKRMLTLFQKIRKTERRLSIADSVVKLDLPIPAVSKKRKISESAPEAFTVDDTLLNTNLPENVAVGRHGQVVREPLGIFFQNFQQQLRFFRAEQLGIASSRLLLTLYDIAKNYGNDTQFISILLEEINKRADEPIIKKFRNEL